MPDSPSFGISPRGSFHWLLTAGFIASTMIALLTDGERSVFPLHAIIGLALALMVVLRVMWGFIGTQHARFASFLFGPGAVIVYLKDALGQGASRPDCEINPDLPPGRVDLIRATPTP